MDRDLIRPVALFGVAVNAKMATARRFATPKAKAVIRLRSTEIVHASTLIAVVALLIVAFAMRAWGNRFGLPFLFHPDESMIVERAMLMMRTGDFNPQWFHYPSLYMYVQTISDILVYLGLAAKQIENLGMPQAATPEYVQFGRATTAFLGSLTVLVVYFAGRVLFSVKVGLLAAALLAFSLLHTIHSHYVTTDVPMTFFATLSFLMSAKVLRTGEGRYYLLAGLTAGLAASTKYNGAIAIVSLVVAHCLVALRTRSLLNLRVTLALPGFALGFLIGTPYALLDLPKFLNDFAFEIAHYRSGQPGFEGTDNAIWYLGTIIWSWDGIALLLALAGAVVCLIKRRANYFLVIAFPVFYFWWFSNFIVRFERNLVPLTPFIALLAALFIDWLGNWLSCRWRRPTWIGPVAVIALLTITILPSAVGIAQFGQLLSDPHSKTIAADWANKNLPRGARIAVEHYGIPLDPKTFELVNVLSLSNYNADWFIEQKFDYVVLSDGIWSRLYMEPDKYSKEVAAYKSIFDRFKLLKSVEPKSPSWRLSSYPTVDVYHLPKIRILQAGGEAQ